MTTTSRTGGHLTYQVQVAGVLGPAIRREFADLSATSISVSTVFRLRLDARQGPAEIAEMLHRKGLVLLRARNLGEEPACSSPQEAQAPAEDQRLEEPPGARPDA